MREIKYSLFYIVDLSPTSYHQSLFYIDPFWRIEFRASIRVLLLSFIGCPEAARTSAPPRLIRSVMTCRYLDASRRASVFCDCESISYRHLRISTNTDADFMMQTCKRSACDRCRDQKLRCRREDGRATSCVRCLRADVPCVTSNSKPIGRPVRRPLYENLGYNHFQSSSHTNTRAYDETQHSLGVSTSDASQQNNFPPYLSPQLDMLYSSHNDSIDSPHDQLWDSMMFDMPADNFSLAIDDVASFLRVPSEADNHETPHEDFCQTEGRALNAYPLTPRHSANHSPGDEKSQPVTAPVTTYDPLHALSDLNRFLVQSYGLLRTDPSCPTPWRIRMDDHSDHDDTHGHNSERNQSTQASFEANPVGAMLRNTSEFTSVVRAWSEYMCSKGDKAGTKGSSAQLSDNDTTQIRNQSIRDSDTPKAKIGFNVDPTSDLLTKPTILLILTNYILILNIYDLIFARLRDVIEKLPDEVANVRFEPEIKMGGFALPQGYLYLKIILQAFEHQYQLIENCLGLPIEYRVHCTNQVSERQKSSPSWTLFGGTKYRSLLRTVMDEGLVDEDEHLSSSETGQESPKRNIPRLRENLAKVKELLQGFT